jgi:hypothetical protein
VDEIFAALFRSVGFVDIDIRTIRKRTSKKELYEYVVSARKATSDGSRHERGRSRSQ